VRNRGTIEKQSRPCPNLVAGNWLAARLRQGGCAFNPPPTNAPSRLWTGCRSNGPVGLNRSLTGNCAAPTVGGKLFRMNSMK
jgi:hypothetical protein